MAVCIKNTSTDDWKSTNITPIFSGLLQSNYSSRLLSIKSCILVIFYLHMNHGILEKVSEFKDLGEIIDSKINFHCQTALEVAKANRMLTIIKRSLPTYFCIRL